MSSDILEFILEFKYFWESLNSQLQKTQSTNFGLP